MHDCEPESALTQIINLNTQAAMAATPDDIALLLATPTPRQIPPRLLETLRRGEAIWQISVGLLVACFGSIFAVLFFPYGWTTSLRLAAGPVSTTYGHVTEATPTGMSVGEVQVVKYHFNYTVDDTLMSGVCYTSGPRWSTGAEVPVRYLGGSPAVACIDGARCSAPGLLGSLVLLFPTAGLAIAGAAVLSQKRRRRILEQGNLHEAEVISVEQTSIEINDERVYKIALQSPGLCGGQPLTVKQTDTAVVALAQERARSRQPIYILADLKNPKHMLFPESWIPKA
jgi:hypothetical protein